MRKKFKCFHSSEDYSSAVCPDVRFRLVLLMVSHFSQPFSHTFWLIVSHLHGNDEAAAIAVDSLSLIQICRLQV